MNATTRTFLVAATLAACSEKPTPAEPPRPAPPVHQDESGHESLPTRVRLRPSVAAEAGIKTAAANSAALPETVSVTGEIIADPDRSARVTARVAGRVVDVRFKEGEHITKGALLAVLESEELAHARAASTSASAKYATARQNADRLGEVARKGLASGQEVGVAVAEARSLEAEARAARQTLTAFGSSTDGGSTGAARLELRAPISGVVLARDAIRGQTVAAEHVLASLADLDQVYFVARLFEKDLSQVRAGAPVEVRLNAYPKEMFSGVVETVGRQLDPSARTVTARIVLANRNDMLRVGLFGNALIAIAGGVARTPRIVVPSSAVTQLAGKDVVFVRQPDEDFEVHPVTLGHAAAGQVEVLTGLREHELVAIDGVFALKSAVLKSTFGEDD